MYDHRRWDKRKWKETSRKIESRVKRERGTMNPKRIIQWERKNGKGDIVKVRLKLWKGWSYTCIGGHSQLQIQQY